MKYVEKGFELKGLKVGQYIDGKMIIGIENSEVNYVDVAVLNDKITDEYSMKECGYSNTFKEVYGLKEYEDSDKTEWLDSEDYTD